MSHRPKSMKLARTLSLATQAAVDRRFPSHTKEGKRRKYKISVRNGIVDDETMRDLEALLNNRP